MIPGLEKASFNHLGSVHRNTFLNARKLLNSDLSTKQFPDLYFAGQITGVEGYTESAAMGLYAAHQLFRRIQGQAPLKWPESTAMGALVNYILSSSRPSPSNINFGLLPRVILPKQLRRLRKQKKRLKRLIAAHQARLDLHELAHKTSFSGTLPETTYPAELEEAFQKTEKPKREKEIQSS
ncbi:MAG: FAD-dependent oxidoreductase, partial [Bacteriovoracaceae bacterium]